MAINFEAANMAGYNNPKIEVFKATKDPSTNAISDAPGKTEIIRCLHRGSIPAIMLTAPDGSEASLLWVSDFIVDAGGDIIAFGDSGYQIIYQTDGEQPMFSGS